MLRKTKHIDIANYVGVSRETIGKIKKNLTKEIEVYFKANPIRLGGPNICVQVDETKLNHNVKSHRGRSAVNPTWALTMVDTSTRPAKGYAKIVSNRSSNTMVPIIETVVRPGSVIHADEWKAYNILATNDDFNLKRITHKYNFVDPQSGVHTQHVESFNNKIKLDIKAQRGVRTDDRP